MKEPVGWTSSRVAIRLFNLKRPQSNREVQVLTAHSNLQRHKKTTGRAEQRWSPRGHPWPRGRPGGHILKSLPLALASKPQVLENCPVLGSRTALCFEQLKFRWKTPETSRKICKHLFRFPHLGHRHNQEGGAGPPPN